MGSTEPGAGKATFPELAVAVLPTVPEPPDIPRGSDLPAPGVAIVAVPPLAGPPVMAAAPEDVPMNPGLELKL
jgi:hypothetical protein